MRQSKLFFLLKAVKKQPREILELEKFVRSPYFNSKQEVIDLLAYIKNYWNDSEKRQEKMLDKKLVFKSLFPQEKKYIAWKINECITELTRLVESFFVTKEIKTNQRFQELILADVLKKRGIDKYYLKKIDAIEGEIIKKQASQVACDAVTFHDLMWYKEHLYFHPNVKKTTLENNARLGTMMGNLDVYYFIKKLRFACEMMTREKEYGAKYVPRLLKEVKAVALKEHKENATIMIYLSILELFTSKDITLIPEIKQELFYLVDHSTLACKLDLILQFFNALPPQYEGRLVLYFELYELALNKGLLIEYGYISPVHFTNIIHIGSALKKINWVDKFIAGNIQYLQLDEDKIGNVRRLFDAYFNFYQGDYRQAFILLDQLQVTDVSYKLRYYTLLLATMIAGSNKIGFTFDFNRHCRNFKGYLARSYKANKISKEVEQKCSHFISLLSKIYTHQHNTKHLYKFRITQKDRAALLKSLATIKEIPFRTFIMKQIEQL